MPSPIDTELRVHDSPVPTQTVSWCCVDLDVADRLYRLLVEHRRVSSAAVGGFPHTAAGGADVDQQLAVLLGRGGERGNASAHGGRTDVARAEAGDRASVETGHACAAGGCGDGDDAGQ